jgi:hypothetical protein
MKHPFLYTDHCSGAENPETFPVEVAYNLMRLTGLDCQTAHNALLKINPALMLDENDNWTISPLDLANVISVLWKNTLPLAV